MDNPVFIIGTLLSLVYTIKRPNEICSDTFQRSVERQFIHGNAAHILANTYVFYQLTTILGPLLGNKQYFALVTLLVFANVVADYFLFKHKVIGCSVGFSGVIFSLLVWTLIERKGFNNKLMLDMVILLVPSIYDPRVSFSGHLIGAIIGAIVYYCMYLTRKL